MNQEQNKERLVEQALLKRAVGYEYTEDVYERKADENGNMTLVLIKQTHKHQPPDPKTAMWWLEHRAPMRWGEGGGVEGGGVIEVPMVQEKEG